MDPLDRGTACSTVRLPQRLSQSDKLATKTLTDVVEGYLVAT